VDSEPILSGLKDVTSKWTRQRKAEERSHSYRTRRQSMWSGPARTSLRDICFNSMDEIWAKASDGGRLPTHWRQMFYLARPIVEAHPESDRPLLDTTRSRRSSSSTSRSSGSAGTSCTAPEVC
jgi:hypothetical protein